VGATGDGSGVWDVPDGGVPYILAMADLENGGMGILRVTYPNRHNMQLSNTATAILPI